MTQAGIIGVEDVSGLLPDSYRSSIHSVRTTDPCDSDIGSSSTSCPDATEQVNVLMHTSSELLGSSDRLTRIQDVCAPHTKFPVSFYDSGTEQDNGSLKPLKSASYPISTAGSPLPYLDRRQEYKARQTRLARARARVSKPSNRDLDELNAKVDQAKTDLEDWKLVPYSHGVYDALKNRIRPRNRQPDVTLRPYDTWFLEHGRRVAILRRAEYRAEKSSDPVVVQRARLAIVRAEENLAEWDSMPHARE
ncbi:hypothetical protein B0A48_13980 [Cryoendolithus antarcticus]|uniref:Uncharacterized protein n=1 Tax=Cryoendolithus antarcticus TaxID=1507870 RepID=A0A1V8SM40_9PEZI|nr:hypothetical protein B0A48_13980 [Cryoendolithus antarcticus]